MPQWLTVTLMALGISVGTIVYLFVLFRLIGRFAMRKLVKRFPPVEPETDAVWGECKRLVIGISKLSGGFHKIAIDERCLHIVPTKFSEWVGIPGASILWSAFDPETLRPAGRHMGQPLTGVRLRDGTNIVGPSWCFDVIDPAFDENDIPES